MTNEQLRQNASAMLALADGKPIQVWFNHKWEDYGLTPKDWHRFQYRPKPSPVTRPWSKPDDVPGPVCWLRSRIATDCAFLVYAIEMECVWVQCGKVISCLGWRELVAGWECSADRKQWLPCTVKEEA